MLEQVILGAIQGVAEWLPVSSEGVLILAQTRFFGGQSMEQLVRQALFLHLGTFLAALIYFRKDVWLLIRVLFRSRTSQNPEATPLGMRSVTSKNLILRFLIVATLISGFLGFVFIRVFIGLEEELRLSSKAITLVIALLLLITGLLQIKSKRGGYKKAGQLSNKDGLLIGFVQGLAALPGLSRSGLTVSTLLLRKFDSQTSLKLSFLMSLPIVLGGNIILNFKFGMFSFEAICGLLSSFIFGLLTISLLLKLARKINFGYFVLIFGILVIVSVFV